MKAHHQGNSISEWGGRGEALDFFEQKVAPRSGYVRVPGPDLELTHVFPDLILGWVLSLS